VLRTCEPRLNSMGCSFVNCRVWLLFFWWYVSDHGGRGGQRRRPTARICGAPSLGRNAHGHGRYCRNAWGIAGIISAMAVCDGQGASGAIGPRGMGFGRTSRFLTSTGRLTGDLRRVAVFSATAGVVRRKGRAFAGFLIPPIPGERPRLDDFGDLIRWHHGLFSIITSAIAMRPFAYAILSGRSVRTRFAG